MNQSTAKDLLANLFVPRSNNLDGVCFADSYMDKSDGHRTRVYEAVSAAMHDSGLSHDFMYTIAEKAVDILLDVEDWQDADDIAQCVDQTIPVYNHDLMEIYENDCMAVDEAEDDYGAAEATDGQSLSVLRARLGWYYVIEQIVHAIINNLPNLEAHD